MILLFLFHYTQHKIKEKLAVAIGQLFVLIILSSISAFFSILASKLPYKAICFMGFIPLIIGIKSIFGKSETYKKKRNYF